MADVNGRSYAFRGVFAAQRLIELAEGRPSAVAGLEHLVCGYVVVVAVIAVDFIVGIVIVERGAEIQS